MLVGILLGVWIGGVIASFLLAQTVGRLIHSTPEPLTDLMYSLVWPIVLVYMLWLGRGSCKKRLPTGKS